MYSKQNHSVTDTYDIQSLTELTDFLQTVNLQINQNESVENILQYLVDGIKNIYDFAIVTCFILDTKVNELTMTNISLEKAKLKEIERVIGFNISKMTIPLFEGSQFAEVIESRKSMVIEDSQSSMNDYTPQEDLRNLSAIVNKILGPVITYRVPLVFGDEVIGIFGASRSVGNDRACIGSDLKILEHVAPKVALIVNKAQSEQILQESEKSYRTLMELSPDPIIIVDTAGNILDANSALLKISGFTTEEIVDKHFSEAPFLPSGTSTDSMKRFRSLLEGNLESPYEVVWRTKDGGSFVLEIRISAIKKNGQTVAFQSIGRDISDRKELEQELQMKNQQLEEKNIALKVMLNQLEHEKLTIQNQISENVNRLIIPVMKNLKDSLSERQSESCDLVLERLENIISPFAYNLSSGSSNLTNKELEICDLIKHGYSSKDIGKHLNISFRTVETHRNNIRKKLKLANNDINLQAYLKSL